MFQMGSHTTSHASECHKSKEQQQKIESREFPNFFKVVEKKRLLEI
jgi:hypothetical protein